MNATGTQSLKHIALVKVAAALWNQDIIRVVNYDKVYKVVEKVQRLSQPELLKKEIIGFVEPIGLEILKWMKYHKDFLSLANVKKYLSMLIWTSQGTVNKKKTAEVLIKDEDLDITDRYKLACVYCLEDDIPKLWKKIPENRRSSFYSRAHPLCVKQPALVVFWTYGIMGEIAKMENVIKRRLVVQHRLSTLRPRRRTLRPCRFPDQYAFEFAVHDGNKAASEYFLQKLTSVEKDESLVRSAKAVIHQSYLIHHADVFCFLLSEMDKEQQIKVFNEYPENTIYYYERNNLMVLGCLLVWPWQSLFMETANHMWDFLSECDYENLLKKIVDKVIAGHKNFDYQELFSEFWQKSPNTHKRYVIKECARWHLHHYGIDLLSKLCDINDEENIKLILKDANLIEKKKIIFSDVGHFICLHLIYGNDYNLVKLLIRECISSKKEMIKFKEKFEDRVFGERMLQYRSEEKLSETKAKWDKFYQLLDDFICGY